MVLSAALVVTAELVFAGAVVDDDVAVGGSGFAVHDVDVLGVVDVIAGIAIIAPLRCC